MSRTSLSARATERPIYVKNVAEVKLGNAFRTGSLDKNGKEAVGGVVIMRYGVSALEVIDAVKKKIEEIKPGLPEGVSIVPFYDRTELINRTADTLKYALDRRVHSRDTRQPAIPCALPVDLHRYDPAAARRP